MKVGSVFLLLDAHAITVGPECAQGNNSGCGAARDDYPEGTDRRAQHRVKR